MNRKKFSNLLSALFITSVLTLTGTIAVQAEALSHEGMYQSELTNEYISLDLKDQRPIAAVIDNEITALDHLGVNQADIVYEIVNSMENERITRLTAIVKDWRNIQSLGSIRSARPTNFLLAAEYNAILCHDGGPYFINQYVARNYSSNLSGGFARFSNGKATEFTEYLTAEDYTNPDTRKTYPGLISRIDKGSISVNYNDYYEGPHFTFSDHDLDLSAYDDAQTATEIALPFPHTSSALTYNKATGLYELSMYHKPHIDALTNEVTSFRNVILQNCDYTVLDEHGYMQYNLLSSTVHNGYYLTNGKAIPITWIKESEAGITDYRIAANDQPLILNTGKTYIGIITSDTWDTLSIK